MTKQEMSLFYDVAILRHRITKARNIFMDLRIKNGTIKGDTLPELKYLDCSELLLQAWATLEDVLCKLDYEHYSSNDFDRRIKAMTLVGSSIAVSNNQEDINKTYEEEFHYINSITKSHQAQLKTINEKMNEYSDRIEELEALL